MSDFDNPFPSGIPQCLTVSPSRLVLVPLQMTYTEIAHPYWPGRSGKQPTRDYVQNAVNHIFHLVNIIRHVVMNAPITAETQVSHGVDK